MTTIHYKVDDFKRILSERSSSILLPTNVKDIILALEKAISIYIQDSPIDTIRGNGCNGDNYRVKRSDTGDRQIISRGKKLTTVREPVNHSSSGNWNTVKPFKTTLLIQPAQGIEKHITDIRIALNKISVKNYIVQRDAILLSISAFEENDDVVDGIHKIAQAIFDTASTNKFFSELYATLYKELMIHIPVLSDILEEFINTYKSAIDNIIYVDADIDYDGFCVYMKLNERRKATASFIVMLMNQNVLESYRVEDIIRHFQEVFCKKIEDIGKNNEIEEIAETIFVFLTLGKVKLAKLPFWREYIIPTIISISKMKHSEHISLTNRSIFKYMDMVDTLKSTR